MVAPTGLGIRVPSDFKENTHPQHAYNPPPISIPTLTSVFPTFLDPDHAPLSHVKHLVHPFLTELGAYRELLDIDGARREKVLESLLNKNLDPFTAAMGLLLATKLRLAWGQNE